MLSPRYPRLQDALIWAAKLHAGQDRDGVDPLPYITHPVDVVLILRYLGQINDESMLCAAALHDTIEECGATADEIALRFGEGVASLVVGLTRVEPSEAERRGLAPDEIWELRSRLLLDEIREMPPAEQQIKLADRVSNLRQALLTRTGKKRSRYVDQSREILLIVPRARNPAMWDEIRRLIDSEVRT